MWVSLLSFATVLAMLSGLGSSIASVKLMSIAMRKCLDFERGVTRYSPMKIPARYLYGHRAERNPVAMVLKSLRG